MPIIAIVGPRETGPGEREQMLDRAAAVFAEHGLTDHVRIDVPGRGAGTTAESDSSLRTEVLPLVPALQSGSLFGDMAGVLVVDAHQLLKSEVVAAADMVAAVDPDGVAAVFVADGSLPAPLKKVISDRGEIVSIKKIRERDASEWLGAEAKRRGIHVDQDAARVLLHRFGSDVAALGRALDQLEAEGKDITGESVAGRFANRPDEPMWYLSDAISAGKEGDALRRLADYLEHGHPLALLAFLEGEVRRRSLALAAPDIETYASWVGSNAKAFPVRKVWERRHRARPDNLTRSLDALARADLTLKTEPEPVHRVTLERLTVALCRWLG